MELRKLGKTDLELPIISFGASSLGQEFRKVRLEDALKSVEVALELGMNFIDTSHFYGRGMSEVLLGIALRDTPRDNYMMGTKVGRYDLAHFDFSPKRIAESVDISLHRLGIDYLDICLLHDIEFVDLYQIVEEAVPALRKAQKEGKVRYVGISGFPMKVFTWVIERTDIDVILSYNQYTLQNTCLEDITPFLIEKGVGIMNAGPFAARLLTNATLPPWHKEPENVKAACRKAAEYCQSKGVDIAQLAMQFSVSHPNYATCISGSANPDNIRKWARWIEEPVDQELMDEVIKMLEPVKNISHFEGRLENN